MQEQMQKQEINLCENINVIIRRKWIIITVFFAAIIAAAAINSLMPRIYEISMILEPSRNLDLPENIEDEIKQKAFNSARNVNFEVSRAQNSDLMIISLKQEKGKTKLGIEALNALFIELFNDYKEIIDSKRDEIEKQIFDISCDIAEATLLYTAQYKMDKIAGNKSGNALWLDGDGDYLSITDCADWNFGTGNFTIDFWVYTTDADNATMVMSQFEDLENNWFIGLKPDGSGTDVSVQIYFEDDNLVKGYYDSYNPSATGLLSKNNWHHVAIVRDGTTMYIFIDGVSNSLTVYNAIESNGAGDMAASLDIGTMNKTDYFNGWLDEIRISKGIARWTANFTITRKKYTSDAYTTLLLHFDDTNGVTSARDAWGGDESNNNYIVTYNTTQTYIAQAAFGNFVANAVRPLMVKREKLTQRKDTMCNIKLIQEPKVSSLPILSVISKKGQNITRAAFFGLILGTLSAFFMEYLEKRK